MNSINFLGQDRFPVSIETMDFMQSMIGLAAGLALLGGDTYILSGCAEAGMNVSDGLVVIGGEILPFRGGAKLPTVYIDESRRDVSASGYNFPQAYKTREAAFGLGTPQYSWAAFKRVDTNLQLRQAIENLKTDIESLRGIPAGVIVLWSGNPGQVPAGWALCDGLNGRPNLMGRFVVGYNQNDDEYNAVGKTGGSKQVTLTVSQLPPHDHEIRFSDFKWGDNADNRPFPNKGGTNNYDRNRRTEDTGGGLPHENRPPYYVLAYIIKV